MIAYHSVSIERHHNPCYWEISNCQGDNEVVGDVLQGALLGHRENDQHIAKHHWDAEHKQEKSQVVKLHSLSMTLPGLASIVQSWGVLKSEVIFHCQGNFIEVANNASGIIKIARGGIKKSKKAEKNRQIYKHL